jgi:hypothetical protein
MSLDPAAYHITPMRQLTQPALTYWRVASQPVPFAELDAALDDGLDRLYAAKSLAGLDASGPDITRYYPVGDGSGLYTLEAGIVAPPDTPPAGEARLEVLPPYSCAAVLLWGSLVDHIAEAYAALDAAIRQANLEPTGECREWNYHFESVTSPNNLIGLYRGVR